MNHCESNWNIVEESRPLPENSLAADQKKIVGPDHELKELLWQNGQVVLNNRTHRKPTSNPPESQQFLRSGQGIKGGVSFGNSGNLIQEDESAPWLPQTLDDSMEEFYSEFFLDPPPADSSRMNSSSMSVAKDEKSAVEETHAVVRPAREVSQSGSKQSDNLLFTKTMMPPPKSQIQCPTEASPNADVGRILNFPQFSKPLKTNLESSNELHGEVEYSVVPMASSYCGSNQIHSEANFSHASSNGVSAVQKFCSLVKGDGRKTHIENESGLLETLETTVTSSSGGSKGAEVREKQATSNWSNKRKERDAEESECQSEEAEYVSVEASKLARSASTRRTRAAEVHNLSERRRRDRINEKMRALQELIPHCNNSDKASMLDDAIEYLKSLQLQLQVLWIGSGMSQMMYPSFQYYFPTMVMGMQHPTLPSVHGSVPLPSIPLFNHCVSPLLTNQMPACPSQFLNPVDLQNQAPNARMPDSYAHYPGIQHTQTGPQATNLFMFSPETLLPEPKMLPPSSIGEPPSNSVLANNLVDRDLG